ncbi:MAG: hypothetical protein J0I48_06390 [Devosia sp.]|uniref:hypothetical protein n=1 Tax=Devosia sp. 66-22 TaxID=1895753 RepID=UPI0009298AAD|nr:hypothetical protein [Devosia sp. 66-22]MBN9345825.1 hypothetical protein [Devosia sp.]OJX48705.1 MAG: hypothetical protein BGO81_18670 [Devosia sp. 66-22]
MTDKAPWRASAVLLILAGLSITGIGVYFVVVRPPLLPEDLRFLGTSAVDIAAGTPRLAAWLSNVFRVLGGYALATGLLTIALAATSYRRREPLAIAGAVAAGASGIGLMVFTNFAINSDFRWVLLALALLWVASLISVTLEARNSTPISMLERN